jgi:hypothetical protein
MSSITSQEFPIEEVLSTSAWLGMHRYLHSQGDVHTPQACRGAGTEPAPASNGHSDAQILDSLTQSHIT